MTSEPTSQPPFLRQGLWGVTWPLLLSLAFSISLSFVDAFFLARVSDHAAAAAGALVPVLGATVVVFTAVGQAGASVAAQLLGARRYAEVPSSYFALVLFNLAVGSVTSLGFWLLSGSIPRWLGLSGDVAEYGRTYLAIIGGFQFLKAAQVAYGSILNSRGATRWVLAEALLTNLCNVLINVALLRGGYGLPPLSVRGVASATAISLGIGLLFTVCVVRLRLRVRFPRASLGALRKRLRQILRVGLPSALEPVSYQTIQAVINAMVVAWGTAALTARTYVFSFVMVTSVLWGLAFGIGTQVVVAHAVGAESFARANSEMRKGLLCAVTGNLLLSLALALFQRPLLSLLTQDPAVHALAAPLFWLGLLVEPARAVNIVAGGALRSTGDARYTSIVGLSMMWTVGLPICYLLSHVLKLGLPGLWLGFAIDEASRAWVSYRRWQSGRWRVQRVSLHPPHA